MSDADQAVRDVLKGACIVYVGLFLELLIAFVAAGARGAVSLGEQIRRADDGYSGVGHRVCCVLFGPGIRLDAIYSTCRYHRKSM